jgi:hypothetical protein
LRCDPATSFPGNVAYTSRQCSASNVPVRPKGPKQQRICRATRLLHRGGHARRVGHILREPNFGLIEIDWAATPGPLVRLQARDVTGEVRLEQHLSAADLVV